MRHMPSITGFVQYDIVQYDMTMSSDYEEVMGDTHPETNLRGLALWILEQVKTEKKH